MRRTRLMFAAIAARAGFSSRCDRETEGLERQGGVLRTWPAALLLSSLLLSSVFLCACTLGFAADPEKAKIAADLAATKSQLSEVQQRSAQAAKALQSANTELDTLRKRTTAFALAGTEDHTSTYNFDDGIINLSQAILAALTNGLVDPAPQAVSVGPITLGGLPRAAREGGRSQCEVASSKPNYESLDNLGPWIEELLKQRLTEHRVVTIVDRAPITIRGSYVPDTPTTIKILVRLFTGAQNAFHTSFTRTINTGSINKTFVHFINQFDDSGPK